MKNVLLLIAIAVLGITQTQAQCTSNNVYLDSLIGFYPTQMPNMVAGQAYNATVTVLTPNDTTVEFSGITLNLYVQANRIGTIDGLPDGFTFSPSYNGTIGGANAWINSGGTPPWSSVLGCLVISASAASVDAAIAANNGDTQLHYTYQVDPYMKNMDPQSPILSTYTWGSTIGALFPFDVNGGGTGNPPPPPICYYDLSYQGNLTSYAGLEANAGSFTIDVLTDTCYWDVTGGASWFTYSPTSGTGPGSITFTYDANTTGVGRFEYLTIGDIGYVVSQMADSCSMNVTYNTIIYDPWGGNSTIDMILSDPNCYWNLVTRDYCDWVHLDPEYGTGSTTIAVTIDANPDNQIRQCELDFGNGHTVTLNQDAAVGISETKSTVFDLYPNPANDFITIATPAITGKEVVSIYTIAGQLLSQTQLTNTKQQISTSNLANGMYVFTVQNAQGIAGRKKVVINR